MLAFGGLDVAVGANPADRTVQIIRFGLFVVANIGIFGAALALAAPLAASIVLIVGAVAWVAASFLTRHGNELVLFITPALLVIAAILSLIAWFRRPRREETDVEIIRPLSARRDEDLAEHDDDEDEDGEFDLEPEVDMPAFVTEPPRRSSRNNAPDPEDFAPAGDDWDPRRKRQVPPRTRPGFREIEPDEYEDEPSFLSRLTLGASGVLSFALYAGLAGAAVLIFWNMRPTGTPQQPTAAAASPVISSEEPVRVAEVTPPPAAPEPERLAPSSAAMPDPTLTSTQPAATDQPAVRAVGETTAPPPGANSVTITPDAPPAPAATSGLTSTTEPPPPLQQAPTPIPGQPMPMFLPASMAALQQQEAPDPVDAPPPAAAPAVTTLAPLTDSGL